MEQLPAWDNSTEYKGIESADYNSDFDIASELISEIEKLNSQLKKLTGVEQVIVLQMISSLKERALILISNLYCFVSRERSLDLKNESASKAESLIDQISSLYAVAVATSELILQKCNEEILHEHLNSESTKTEAFYWCDKRKMKDFSLSEAEEMTLAQFKRFGRDGRGDL